MPIFPALLSSSKFGIQKADEKIFKRKNIVEILHCESRFNMMVPLKSMKVDVSPIVTVVYVCVQTNIGVVVRVGKVD